MTDCADSTTLRSHLDHPDAVLDAHLDTCDECAGLLRSVAADSGVTRQALALLDPADDTGVGEVDLEAALAAALAGTAPPAELPSLAARRHRRARSGRRLALSGAAAMLAVVVALTPAGRDAVAGVLDVFRSQRIQPVTVDTAALAAAFDAEDAKALGALGNVDTSGLSEPDEVTGLAAAEATAGIPAPRVTDPPDRWVAMAPGTARLKLVARNGNGVPAELDGATLVVNVPGAIGAVYGGKGGGPSGRGSGDAGPSGRGSGDAGPSGRGSGKDGVPKLVVARTGPLVVRSEGAPLEAVRSFVLTREELPADLRNQLAAIGDWRSTIPVPVPLDGPGWQEVEVGGRPAVAFGDDAGTGALVIRQDPDGVTLVGGRMGISQALDLAGRA